MAGRLGGTERGHIDGHLANCDRCVLLVSEATRDTGSAGARRADSLRPPLLLPGMTVASRYHVRRLLGIGAMGEVHEVDDELLGTTVALKTLNAKLAGNLTALARLKREVAAARRVTHPNVCRIFDLGIDHGNDTLGPCVFLTMELLPGVTLSKFLLAHGALLPRRALPLLLQLADGLAAAHTAGVVHRDLKSDNVMFVEQDDHSLRAVITDFGLASFVMQDDGGVEGGSSFSGTLAYAAPERFLGARATAASDVYSLGLIAAQILTGRPPVPAGLSETRIDMAGVTLPSDWLAVLTRAVDRDPDLRFPHAAAVAEALRKLGPGPTPKPRGWAGLAAAAAVAVAAAGAIVATLAGPGRESRDVLADEPGRLVVPATAVPLPVVASDRVAAAAEPAHITTSLPKLPQRTRRLRRPQPTPLLTEQADGQQATPAVDDLVRELRFPAAQADSDSRDVKSATDLVDPFARRRSTQVDR
jgi:serine/threonine protein kinase